jgi:hypothetical protein
MHGRQDLDLARRRLDQYRERPLAKAPLSTARGTDSSPQSRSCCAQHTSRYLKLLRKFLGAIERKPFGNLSLVEIMMVFILVILACCVAPSSQTVTTGQNVVTASQVNGTWESKRGEFKVRALGNQKLRVEFSGFYDYVSQAGRMVNTGEGKGIAFIEGNTAIFKPDGAEEECRITMKFTGGKLFVTQEGVCGFGLNVTAAGTYRKLSSRVEFTESISAPTLEAEKVINAHIRKEAKSQGAAELRERRKVLFGDVDGDGDEDAVAYYMIEGMGGGNTFAQMLAIFTNQEGVYRFTTEEVVGGKYAYRISKLTNVENGKIYLSTETCPEPPQGLCDNPKKGRAVFTFNNGNLKEL